MNEKEVYELFQMTFQKNEHHLIITFDTNALYSDKRFLAICDNINKLKIKGYKIDIIISSLVHAEKLLDLKQKRKDEYDINYINKILEDKKVSIVSFEYHHAETIAELIGKQFPTDEQWRTFKRQKCIDCLGIRRIKDDIPSL